MNLEEKIEKVKDILNNEKIAISFSGGADSSLMCYLASKVCSDVLAVTVDNNILPTNFIENTEKFCEKYNIKQEIVFEDFYKHEDIISNTPKRCYLCRKEMYKHIIEIANKNGFKTIVDGTNISDLIQDRPGILVNYKNNIRSPFVKARLTSKEIHEYLDKNNITYSKATTCLATRVPFNEKFTKEKYDRISKSENFIYENTNCKIVKVREKYPDCIVEVDNIYDLKQVNASNVIIDQLNANGYGEVILNLEELKNNDDIIVSYMNNKFIYQLPFEIDLERTKIENENISITEDGMVLGKNCETYEDAINEFIDILPNIIRKIPDLN